MSRSVRPRTSGQPARAVPLKSRDIPDWIRKVAVGVPPLTCSEWAGEGLDRACALPRGHAGPHLTRDKCACEDLVQDQDRLELFELARVEPVCIVEGVYADYFKRLAEDAERTRIKQGPGVTLVLLDVVPGYIRHIERFPWIRDDLCKLFQERAYWGFKALQKRIGKIGTDKDLIRLFLVGNEMTQIMPTRDPESPGELRTGRLVESGVSKADAVRRVVESERRLAGEAPASKRTRKVNAAARKSVRTSLERASKKLKPRERSRPPRKRPPIRRKKIDDFPDE